MGSLSEAFCRSRGLNPAGGTRLFPHPSLGQPKSWRGRWENPDPDPRNLCGAAFPGSCLVLWVQEGGKVPPVTGCVGAGGPPGWCQQVAMWPEAAWGEGRC